VSLFRVTLTDKQGRRLDFVVSASIRGIALARGVLLATQSGIVLANELRAEIVELVSTDTGQLDLGLIDEVPSVRQIMPAWQVCPMWPASMTECDDECGHTECDRHPCNRKH